MEPLRLLIVNKTQVARDSWSLIFASRGGFTVVEEIDELNDLDILLRLQPDVVLIGLKDQVDNVETIIDSIKQICPWTLVIVFAELNDNTGIPSIFLAGADGYLNEPILPIDLVKVIEFSCRTGVCFFPRSAKDPLIGA